MKHTRIITLILCPILFSFQGISIAQDEDTCPAIVQTALEATDNACQDTARNEACYGNVRLEAEPQADTEDFTFTQQGDRTPVAALQTLTLHSMDTATGEWGVALMRIQANLPDTLPGQNVTFLLFGDVEITNAGDITPQTVQIDVTTTGNANLRAGPSTDQAVIGSLTTGQVVTADGRLADSTWLRLVLPDSRTGWVFASLVTSESDLSALGVVEPTDTPIAEPQYGPMQAVYFRSGVGDAACATAPESGILIQTPEGVGEIDLMVNEVSITLSSTVFLQAQAPGMMTINGIEDAARVAAFDVSRPIAAGSRVQVPLDENRAASGPPGSPEPYDAASLRTLPLQYLDRPVSLPPPLTQSQIEATATPMPTTVPGETFTDLRDDVFACDTEADSVDPEVDITELFVARTFERNLFATVRMADPLTRDFSFAVMLVLAFGDNFQFYIWEIHDGVFRIGELDAITGEYINISDESMYIEHDRSTGIISFLIPESHLPDRIDQIGARSFHTPFRETRPQPTTCDFAGLYNLPESLR